MDIINMHLILLILYGSTEDVRNLMHFHYMAILATSQGGSPVTENLNFTIQIEDSYIIAIINMHSVFPEKCLGIEQIFQALNTCSINGHIGLTLGPNSKTRVYKFSKLGRGVCGHYSDAFSISNKCVEVEKKYGNIGPTLEP